MYLTEHANMLRELRCLRRFLRRKLVSWNVSFSFTCLARVGQRVRAIIFFSAFVLRQLGWAFSVHFLHNKR